MINKIFLSGRVGDKIYDNATQSGKRIINFSIVQEVPKVWEGEEKMTREFHKVTSWDEKLDIGPGDFVMIEGRLTNYKNKNGEYEKSITAQKIEIIVQNVQNKIPSFDEGRREEAPF